jgi:hypothetical protein
LSTNQPLARADSDETRRVQRDVRQGRRDPR